MKAILFIVRADGEMRPRIELGEAPLDAIEGGESVLDLEGRRARKEAGDLREVEGWPREEIAGEAAPGAAKKDEGDIGGAEAK